MMVYMVKYVYGIKGISRLLNCSLITAQRIKSSGKINAALRQIGRKIIVDADLALELIGKNLKCDALDNVLNVTCEVTGIKRENITSRRRIDYDHQAARIVFCRVAGEKFDYTDVGRKINRRKQQVCHNINNTNTDYCIDYYIKEVKNKLSENEKF